MRIDSSSIGMESARKYSSVSGRVSKFVITNRRQGIKDGTGALFGNLLGTDVEEENTQAKGKENPDGDLKSRLEEMQNKIHNFRTEGIRSVDVEDARKQLQDIRQQCIIFLMNILFPDRGSSVTSSTGTNEGFFGTSERTFQYTRQSYYEESEDTCFTTQGTVKCADGREINFNLNVEMSRSFQEYYEETLSMKPISMCDPLVINLDGNIAQLSDQTFLFDLDGDGVKDEINRLSAGSGFLALDKNSDGEINDGTELFGTSSGNGFSDLAAYDDDHNGFIDEGDEIWNKLKIWVMDENGNKQLYSLAEKGVGAICLQNASTDFALTGENNQTNGMIRRTGIFLYENGGAGTVQHVDLALHEKENAGLNMVV